MKKRNTLIDWIKLLYAIPIMLVHSNHLIQGTYSWQNATIMPGGYLTVEFFFIVSGYFMAASAARRLPRSGGGIWNGWVLKQQNIFCIGLAWCYHTI